MWRNFIVTSRSREERRRNHNDNTGHGTHRGRRVTPEGIIKKDVKEALKKMGWFVFHIHQQSYHAHKGISDLIALKKGRTIYLEIKTPIGKTSKAQVEFGDMITEAGGEYYIVRSLEDLIAITG